MPDSRTLVLIHAFPLGARMWAPQHAALEGWRIVTPSLPGFDGQASGMSSMKAFAADVHASLDQMNIGRAVIGGLSLGGYVTLTMLRQRPERASGVILADTRSTSDTIDMRAARTRMLEILDERGPSGVFEEMCPRLFGATTLAERPEIVQRVREMVESQSPSAIEGAIAAMLDRPDSTLLLRSIVAPTLVVVGEEDVMTPPSESEDIQAGIRGAALARIPHAGHLSNLENPEAFNTAIREFLATIPD